MNARVLASIVVLTNLALCPAARAQATPDPNACAGDLARSNGTFSDEATKAELAKADCEERSVFCVDASGYPIPGEQRDPQLKSGQSLIVKLFGPSTCEDVLTVGSDVQQSDVTLFRATPAEKARGGAAKVVTRLLAKATVTTDAASESVTVVVSRLDNRLSIQGVTLVVTPPRYFLDVGLLVAFTPAYQTVSTSRAPGSTEQFIRTENTIHPSAAVTINYFPAGQYSVPRFSDYHGLGIQAGIGGDLTRLDDEFYLGAIWEPIPGAGVAAGLAMLSMEKLHPDYPAGALVNPNDVPKDTFLGPRFYFGITLNTQVFQTALSLGGKAIVPK
jgi:hypothetical protein